MANAEPRSRRARGDGSTDGAARRRWARSGGGGEVDRVVDQGGASVGWLLLSALVGQPGGGQEFAEPGMRPVVGKATERQLLGDGPFVGGAKLQVADLKLYMIVRWFATGTIDHVPATVFDAYPKLQRVYKAVGDHAGVKAWQARPAS